ncbi:tyrosine-type recombinase/integrase [Planctomicrobium sp. SH668]|uniref:tyrosine-type recombinase/integrase n=1 Tax=Planctomicrobium sp. SH668 TaxID=3448126 RepID=UPI003F5C2738
MTLASLTVRKAFEEYYFKDELGERSHYPFMAAFLAWEKLTNNPSITNISNAMLESFRNDALQLGLSPRTVNGYWGHIRSVLRRCGPVTDQNPWALELIPRVPAMRPCKVPFKRPRRLTMDELNRLYLAARHMRKPIRDVSVSAFWWQALLVLAYNTGLRAGDLLNARWENLDTQEQTIYVKSQKTGVDADLPLHALTLAHLSRVPRSSEFLFDIDRRYLYELWGLLKKQAGVRCGLHDIRRTACSEYVQFFKRLLDLLHSIPNQLAETGLSLDDSSGCSERPEP